MGIHNRSANKVDALVGANLRQLRTSASMSQSVLGDLLGVTFQQIQKYERGSNRIGASRLWAICQVFSILPNDLYKGLIEPLTRSDRQADERIDLFQHPRGAIMAKAFMSVDDHQLELSVIELCKSMGKTKL